MSSASTGPWAGSRDNPQDQTSAKARSAPLGHLGRVLPSSVAGAIPEIEITPEMVRVGVSEFVRFDERFESYEECVVRIFTAMLQSRNFGSRSGGEC